MFNYSIIIPHKNIPSLLRRCLDSIPERNDLEIIVVDDNSDEETIKDLQAIHRNNLQIIYTKEGKGAGYARNIGVSKSQGEWILFADADDFFLPNLFESLDKYRDYKQPLILFQSYCRNSDNLETIGTRQWICDMFSRNMNDFKEDKISNITLLLGFGVPWGKMIKKSFLEKQNISFEEVRYSNDIGWITQLAISTNCNDIAISDDLLYCFTDRIDSLYYIRNKEAFFCRFEVRYRQHLLLLKNGIPSNFSFCPFVDDARGFGLAFLLKFYRKILNPNCHIPAIYRFEKFCQLKTPYFYLVVQVVKALFYKQKPKSTY